MIDEPVDAAAENVRDEFVDYLNARDLDAIADMVSAEVTSDLFDGVGVESAVQGLADLVLRYPQLMATRGDDGPRPVVAMWIPDEQDRFQLIGYLELSGEDEQIDRISYVDQPSEDLLVEQPEADELAEWQDWHEWDAGEEAPGRQGE